MSHAWPAEYPFGRNSVESKIRDASLNNAVLFPMARCCRDSSVKPTKSWLTERRRVKYGQKGMEMRQKSISSVLISLHDSQRFRRAMSWMVLLAGLALWIGLQGALVGVPLWTRALFPEVDDSLTYVVKTRQMEECPFQDCLALSDLREEFSVPTSSPEVVKQRNLAISRIFPVYHPLLSAVFLGLKAFGLDLMMVYKLVWTIGPVLFGLAFAYLLSVLWGRTAAGLALGFLAFKVFPDTGLHYVVPSNIAMALAVILWAHIISRDGDAAWSMVLGSIVLVTMHPTGRIYAVISAVIAFFMPGFRFSVSRCIAILGGLFVVALAFYSPHLVKLPGVWNPGPVVAGDSQLMAFGKGIVESTIQAFTEVRRLTPGLFVVFPIFCGAVLFGFLTLPHERRRLVLRVVIIYWLFLFAAMFYVSYHPADLVLRMWIPLVAILFGGVARGLAYCIEESWTWIVDLAKNRSDWGPVSFRKAWVLVVFAVLFGYAWQTMTGGVEAITATIRHVRDREPLKFEADQPKILLAHARPGDRVLYTSIMIMPFYFIHGAMSLGAVYYHPAMKDFEAVERRLERPDVRFAAVYNPTVWHPSFEGVDETDWWISAPNYTYSPLDWTRRRPNPLSWEGEIRSQDFRWIEIEPRVADFPGRIKLTVNNPGKPSRVELIPVDREGLPLGADKVQATIQGDWTGPVALDLPKSVDAVRFRIVFPTESHFRISSMVFGDDKNHWPWTQKALMSFMPKGECCEPITVNFDPADLLPAPLRERPIIILDDNGSSVLLKIGT